MFGLYPGASGLNAYGEAMSVVGSNIANVNTTGYKSSRVNFQDMLATGVRGTGDKLGKGVTIASVNGQFTQGSTESSSQITDLALEGEGFFNLRDKSGRVSYTRAGNFGFDKDGFLVAPNGHQVMVRDIDARTRQTAGFPHGAKVVGLNDPPVATGNGFGGSGVLQLQLL